MLRTYRIDKVPNKTAIGIKFKLFKTGLALPHQSTTVFDWIISLIMAGQVSMNRWMTSCKFLIQ